MKSIHVAGVCVLVLLPGVLVAQEKKAGRSIDNATVAAFGKAGWQYGGWIKNPADGGHVFRTGHSSAQQGHPGFSLGVDVRYSAKHQPPPSPVPFGLRFNDISEARLKELSQLRHLALLDFDWTASSRINLHELANFKDLTTIVFNWERLNDDVVRTLAEIKLLHLLACASTVDGGRAKSSHEIAVLDLRKTRVTVAGIKHLADCVNLTTLHLDKIRSDEVIVSLSEMGLLHSLAEATAKDGSRPKNAEGVAALDLREYRNAGCGVKALGGLKNLESLKLTPEQIDDDVLHALRRFSQRHTLMQSRARGSARPGTEDDIDELFLQHSHVTPTGLQELAGLKNIRMIGLDRDKTTDAALRALRAAGVLHALLPDRPRPPLNAGRSAAELQDFQLEGTPITDAGLKELVDFKNLRSLNLNGTKITNAGLKELSKFERLKLLYLNDTDLTEDAINDIVAIKGLRQVALNNTYFTREGLAKIGKALPGCSVFPPANQPLTSKKSRPR